VPTKCMTVVNRQIKLDPGGQTLYNGCHPAGGEARRP
jgi:hypothetical protein